MSDDAADDSDVAWVPVVPFPDQSASFTHGFEAGMVWEAMQRGDQLIGPAPKHVENIEVFQTMARREGYALDLELTEYPEWCTATFAKQSRRLSVVSASEGETK